MTPEFPWSELDADLEDLLTTEDTGAVVRQQLSTRLYQAFLSDYAEG